MKDIELKDEEIKEVGKGNRNGRPTRKSGKGRNAGKKTGRRSPRTEQNTNCKGNNDPNWYFTDKGLMDTVSKFAFNNFLGYGQGLESDKIPYAMQIFFNPAAASSMDFRSNNNNRTSGINMAALKLYTTLSSQSGKTSNYGPEDIAMLMLSLGDLISFVEFGRRTLGLAFTYNNRNWHYPVNIIEACGFDDSVLTDLAQKRMDFNISINAINKIAFPANIAYFTKCASMYQNVFLDSTSPMSQSFIYVPLTHWVLDETTSESGSILKTTVTFPQGPGTTITWDQYMTQLNDMINAIMMSSTFNYIYGDVLNLAAKASIPMLHLDLVSEDYAVIPVYNELALTQIHNMTAIGSPHQTVYYKTLSDGKTEVQLNTPGNDVIGDAASGTVKYNPAFAYKDLLIQDLYIDSLTPDPDVNVRVDMTRYAIRCSSYAIGHGKGVTEAVKILSEATLPDHYPVYFNLVSASNKKNICVTSNSSEGGAWYSYVGMLTQFDWAPIVYICDNEDYHTDYIMVGDLDYFTSLGADYLKPVNDLCYQGLFELR